MYAYNLENKILFTLLYVATKAYKCAMPIKAVTFNRLSADNFKPVISRTFIQVVIGRLNFFVVVG
jgi:hypothetical protein